MASRSPELTSPIRFSSGTIVWSKVISQLDVAHTGM
jgi:hypothetical protein